MKHYILILLIATLSFGNTNYIAGPPSGYLGQVFKNKSGFYVGFKFGYQYTLDGAWQINPTTTPQEMLYKNDTLWASLDSENPAIHFSTDDGLNYKLLRDDIPGSISDFLYSPPGLLCMEVYHNDNSHNYCINESQQIDSISFEDFLAMGVHPAAAGRIFNNWDAYPSTQMGTLKLDIEDLSLIHI